MFSQEFLVCVWWNQFDCNSAPGLFGNNAYIYDYSKNGQQSSSAQNTGFGGQNAGFGGQAPGVSAPGAPGIGFDQSQGGNIPSSGFGTFNSKLLVYYYKLYWCRY